MGQIQRFDLGRPRSFNRLAVTAVMASLLLLGQNAKARPVFSAIPAMASSVRPAFSLQGSRWTTTATDGAVAEGQALTLTYSFVADGTTIAASTQGSGPSILFATLDANFPGGRAAWKARFAEAFAQWSKYVNITYVEVGDDGAAFPASPGLLGGRGDVRIAMIQLANPANQAVTFFPQFGGDTVLNSDQISEFVDAGNGFRKLLNVIMRQHGTGLGLQAVISDESSFLMEPGLQTDFLGPQEDDIRGSQFLYGDRFEPNESSGEAEFVGGPLQDPTTSGNLTLTIEDVSLGRSNDADWYAFTGFAEAPIAIRVEPVGSTYSFAPQTDPQSIQMVDGAAVRNLGLRLWRRVSAQTGEIQLLAQINFNPAGAGEYHPPITYSLAGYLLVEVFSTDGIDDVQRYRLRISNADIPLDRPAITVSHNGDAIEDGQTYENLIDPTVIGSTGQLTLLIGNQGTAPLEFTDPSPERVLISGPHATDYAATIDRNAVAPGGAESALMSIVFTPAEAGTREATFTVPTNDPDLPSFSFTLVNQALLPAAPELELRIDDTIVIHGGTFDFAGINIGGSSTVSMQIANAGTATLNVGGISITGTHAAEFTSSVLVATLAPGSSVSGSLSFAPAAAGSRQATLNLANSGDQNPYSITLQGTGQAIVDCNGNNIPDENELDSDGDGIINDCEEEDDGVGAPLPTVGLFRCGNGAAALLPTTFAGLCTLGLVGRRRRD
ncbi:MAG: choice-of-anchor D domain-containing protein [Planctomycetes bacterium]|nr:choice-of-anchor D domain-containing protein [Planctomycetota bacterium]